MARFAELSECDLSCLLAEKDAENTKKATKVSINLFRSYLQEKRLTETEILTSKIKLATVLSRVLSRSYSFIPKQGNRMETITQRLH